MKQQKEIQKLEGQREGLEKLLQTLEKTLKEKNDKLQELKGTS